MKNFLGESAATAQVIAAIVVVIIGIATLSYYLYAEFAPRYTATDYQVYKQSQQYNDGMADRLEIFREAYFAPGASQEARDNVRSAVRHEFASYDETRLNPDLRSFLDQMKGGL